MRLAARWGVLGLAAASALAWWGCAPRAITAAPPCAAVLVENPGGTDSIGQAVWIGTRVLTAAHVLMDDTGALAGTVLLNGEPADVLEPRTGDLGVIRRIYRTGAHPSALTEDWASFRTTREAPLGGRMTLGDGSVRPGEALYAVGPDPVKNDGSLWAIPLVAREAVVVSGDSRTPFPSRLTVVTSGGRPDLRGWSGAFVGRFDRRAGEWVYVGHLVSRVEADGGVVIHAVLRPPEDVLQWLVSGANP